MIRRLIIENFKAIGKRVEIDLRPITLLFGPNAAGKSTVIHALHYAREVLERRNLDAHRTKMGGNMVDLGGFKNLVHGHDMTKSVVLGFEIHWPNIAPDGEPPSRPFERDTTLTDHPISGILREKIESARITFEVAADGESTDSKLMVTRCEIELNEERIAVIEKTFADSMYARLTFNWCHPLLNSIDANDMPDAVEHCDLQDSDWCRNLMAGVTGTAAGADRVGLQCFMPDALPDVHRDLWIVMDQTDSPVSESVKETIKQILTGLVAEPVHWLAEDLAMMTTHIGPLRTLPPRHVLAGDVHEESSWIDGSLAWHYLLGHEDATNPMIQREIEACLGWVNVFLAEPHLLDAGFNIRRAMYRRFEDNRLERERLWNEMYPAVDDDAIPDLSPFVKLLDLGSEEIDAMNQQEVAERLQAILQAANRLPRDHRLIIANKAGLEVSPQDIGVGISQVLPVLIAIFWHTIRYVAIEQPELHLHPRAQVALGDALIVGVNTHLNYGTPRALLIETHSEHILLRLLRRIRETTEGKIPEDQYTRLAAEDLAVIYVEPGDGQAGTQSVSMRRLRVDDNGEFIDRWPKGFFEERAEELFS